MVFSSPSECNLNPSSTTLEKSLPPIKLSTKLENSLLKHGLLSPSPKSPGDKSPGIRKEFYSIITDGYSTQQKLDKTQENLNNSLIAQKAKEAELEAVMEKVAKLKAKLSEKIAEVKESQNEAEKCLRRLKRTEGENLMLKNSLVDIKASLGRMKGDVENEKDDMILELNDLKKSLDKSNHEIFLRVSKLIKSNNLQSQSTINNDFEKVDDTLLQDDSESIHNSSTVSEHSQTSDFYYCYPQESGITESEVIMSFPEKSGIPKLNATMSFPQSPRIPKSDATSNSSETPTLLLLISTFIVFLSIWINLNGSLFGSQPHLQISYSSMPPS